MYIFIVIVISFEGWDFCIHVSICMCLIPILYKLCYYTKSTLTMLWRWPTDIQLERLFSESNCESLIDHCNQVLMCADVIYEINQMPIIVG